MLTDALSFIASAFFLTRVKAVQPPVEHQEGGLRRQLTSGLSFILRDPIMRRLPLCPLIHGGAMWIALQSLLMGGSLVLDVDRHFDPAVALGLLARERVELTMLIGDATARPLADALADARALDPGAFDLSALQVIASGGAVLSASVKGKLRELLPDTAVIDTFGASETGGQGRLSRGDDGSLRLVTDEHTAVLDDELEPVAPGEVGRLARSGFVPLGYHGDAERSAATFPVIDGTRWSVPGDLARLEHDGTITLLGRGSTSINTEILSIAIPAKAFPTLSSPNPTAHRSAKRSAHIPRTSSSSGSAARLC